MTQPSICLPTKAQVETVIKWLKDEYENELGEMSGFYCNRNIIRRAARDSEMFVLALGRRVIGFTVFNKFGIDILEIRPTHRRLGYGRQLANYVTHFIFSNGSNNIYVDCVPHSSQFFWRSIGFIDQVNKYPTSQGIKLVLHDNNKH